MNENALISTHNKEIEKLFRSENRDLAFAVIHIVDELKPYWPLTVRQVYYQCVSHGLINNMHSNYTRISKMLTKLRRNDLVTWQAIEDRSRRTTDKRGVEDMEAFVAEQLDCFLDWRYYHRCRVQEQIFILKWLQRKMHLPELWKKLFGRIVAGLMLAKGKFQLLWLSRLPNDTTRPLCKVKSLYCFTLVI